MLTLLKVKLEVRIKIQMLNKIYIKKLEKEYFIGNVIGDSNCVYFIL